VEPVPAQLAADSRSLDALRRKAGSDPQAATRAAAGQFEALFMRQMLKAMRDAVPRSGMWDGPGQSTYSDMLDQQLAQSLSGRPGGLADVIARQLGRQLGQSTPPAGTAAGATGAAALALGDAMDQAHSATQDMPAPASTPAAAALARAASSFVDAAPARTPTEPGNAVLRQALAAFNATAEASPNRGARADATVPGATGPESGAGAVLRASLAHDPAMLRQAPRGVEPSGAAAAARSPAQPDLSRLSGAQADFVRKVWPHALLAERSTGVPAAFIVGQAALESGWGRHEIRQADGSPSHNLFGIKATPAWQGASTTASTTEYVAGQPTRRNERFRAYGSYAEAFQDWAALIARSPRYGGVVQSGASVEAYAASMQRAGYATDPAYGAKLEKTIQRTLALQRLLT
jgi:flagellar protein FlgJ